MGVIVALAIVVVIVTVPILRRSGIPTREHPAMSVPSAVLISNQDIDPGSSAHGVPAPGFMLRDQRNRATSLRQFRGKVVVLAFVDSHCTTICPLTTQSMVNALRLLGAAAAQVQLIGINANPLAMRIADVAAYTRAHQMQGRWLFLTGSLAQLKHVWNSYHVYVAATHNDIDHQPLVFLIDMSGHERMIYSTRMSYEGVTQQARILAAGIAPLLPGDPPVQHKVSLSYIPPLKPTETARFSSFGPQTVVFGQGHPHLLLFFAGWLGGNSNLSARLAVLDRYAVIARRQGWPTPVAIDEFSTEASTTETQQLLARLAATLRTPIIEDTQGRLADGYRAQDLPWYVLTSRTGEILWQHDGWLSAAALRHKVGAILAN